MVDGDVARLKETVRELRKEYKLKIKAHRANDGTNSCPTKGYQKISGITVEEIINKASKSRAVSRRRTLAKDGRQIVNLRLHSEDVSRLHAIIQYHTCSVIYAVRLLLHHDAKGQLPDPIPTLKRCRKERPPDGSRILVTLSEAEVNYLKSSDDTYANQMHRMIDAYLKAHPEIVA